MTRYRSCFGAAFNFSQNAWSSVWLNSASAPDPAYAWYFSLLDQCILSCEGTPLMLTDSVDPKACLGRLNLLMVSATHSRKSSVSGIPSLAVRNDKRAAVHVETAKPMTLSNKK